MKTIGTILFYCLLITQAFAIVFTFSTVKKMHRDSIYDPDIARRQCLEEIEWAAQKACKHGTDYPEEYRQSAGFNKNSPLIYCSSYYDEEIEKYVIETVAPLGRKDYK